MTFKPRPVAGFFLFVKVVDSGLIIRLKLLDIYTYNLSEYFLLFHLVIIYSHDY